MKILSFRIPVTQKVETPNGVYQQKIDYRVKLIPIILIVGLLFSVVYTFAHFV